jgi:hypothetical protein
MTRSKLIAMLMISAIFAVMVPGEDSAAPDARLPAARDGAREAYRPDSPLAWLEQVQPAAAARAQR